MEGQVWAGDTREEAIYQSLSKGIERDITLVYSPGTMVHIKERDKEDIDSSKAFVALIQR